MQPETERTIAQIRYDLVGVRMAATQAAEDLKLAKAKAETRIIEAAGGDKALGANAEARDRALLIALAADEEYQVKVVNLRSLEATAMNLEEVELENAKDARRAVEWRIREALAAALDRKALDSNRGDKAFDDAMDYGAMQRTQERALSYAEPADGLAF